MSEKRNTETSPEDLKTARIEAFTKKPQVCLRSCWVCNPAHEHMKQYGDDIILRCFGCGHVYFTGVDITIFDGEDVMYLDEYLSE